MAISKFQRLREFRVRTGRDLQTGFVIGEKPDKPLRTTNRGLLMAALRAAIDRTTRDDLRPEYERLLGIVERSTDDAVDILITAARTPSK